jgi:glycosyltransferase involved in cell wall biosynthesis
MERILRSHKKVNIYIPTYKNYHLISACLAACLGQTYNHIDIFVLDNGFQEDGSKLQEIIKNFSSKKITYIPNLTNIGSQGSLNLILDLANLSEYFMVIPADLLLEKHSIEKMVTALETNINANIAFPKSVTKSVKKVRINPKICSLSIINSWPYTKTGCLNSNIVLEYFFDFHNINSEWSHFTYIGALIDGALLKSIKFSRPPMNDHGFEELISMILLVYSDSVVLIEEPLLIIFTDNERYGSAVRPKNNYTRYEPLFAEYFFLNFYEPIILRKNINLLKLYFFLILKTVYSFFKYPGTSFILLPKLIQAILKLLFSLLPYYIYMKYIKNEK